MEYNKENIIRLLNKLKLNAVRMQKAIPSCKKEYEGEALAYMRAIEILVDKEYFEEIANIFMKEKENGTQN